MTGIRPARSDDGGAPQEFESVWCPACGAPAEILPEGWLDSTDGPVEHVRVWCIEHHFFFMPRPS